MIACNRRLFCLLTRDCELSRQLRVASWKRKMVANVVLSWLLDEIKIVPKIISQYVHSFIYGGYDIK